MKEINIILTAFEFRKKGGILKSLLAQEILGKPLLNYSLELAKKFSQKIKLVFCKETESLKEIIKDGYEFLVIENWNQLFKEFIREHSISEKLYEMNFLILRSELPLITPLTIGSLIKEHFKKGNSITLLISQKNSKEIGALIFNGKLIPFLENLKFQRGFFQELYLPIVSLRKEGEKVGEVIPKEENEFIFVEKMENLPKVIEILRLRKIEEIQKKGVRILDPYSTWIDSDVKIGKETIIYPFSIIEGKTLIGKKCIIYPYTHIKDCEISDNVKILTSSFLEGAKVMKGASVGPYSRIRPNTIIESQARIGNFVEVKNTIVGKRSKALHLTYLGDAKIGSDVNVGAGTITCNFDGKNKNTTIIESGAFIGSGTELVAPVKVGKKSYIGAGSTITKDVPPYALGIARERQTNIEKWVKRRKK